MQIAGLENHKQLHKYVMRVEKFWTIVKPVDTFSENFLEETLSLIPEKFFLLIRC